MHVAEVKSWMSHRGLPGRAMKACVCVSTKCAVVAWVPARLWKPAYLIGRCGLADVVDTAAA